MQRADGDQRRIEVDQGDHRSLTVRRVFSARQSPRAREDPVNIVDRLAIAHRSKQRLRPHDSRGFTLSDVHLDGDLRPDLVWLNLNGPARAFLNRGPTGNAIGVRLPNSAVMLGARIEIRVAGESRYAQVIANQGLGADQSRTQMMGLGGADHAESLIIRLSNGAERRYENVPAGTLVRWDGTP